MSTKITVPEMEVTEKAKEWVRQTYIEKFGDDLDFESNFKKAIELDCFKACENMKQELLDALLDPQTSGGLLLSMPEKDALEYLGNITGENVSESIINEIFKKFCLKIIFWMRKN